MKRKWILPLILGCMASTLPSTSYAQTARGSDSRSAAPISQALPTAVLMYSGEPFPFKSGVAVSEQQWEYERRQRALTRTVELAVDAQMPPVTAPCMCPPGAPAVKRLAWIKPALRGFGVGLLAGALLMAI